jgi:hypothetical protein
MPVHSFIDRFSDDSASGAVIGKPNPDGTPRLGVDVERVIGIDNGALRIQPLIKPGWGRSGLCYGPYPRENGLAFAAYLLNGHNTSQAGPLGETLPGRLLTWARGSESGGMTGRLIRWAQNGHKKRFARQLLRWARMAWDYRKEPPPALNENLAVGWFPSPALTDPHFGGNLFVVHGTGAENGELRATSTSESLPVISGLQNIPIQYIVILRQRGAAYYVSSLPNARQIAANPEMRPVAIDSSGSEPLLYPGVAQSVLGQIGFRVDTRVYATQVEALPQYAHWFGTAHAADRLNEGLPQPGTNAETGGAWTVTEDSLASPALGAYRPEKAFLAILHPQQPSGLVHLLANLSSDCREEICLVWRFADTENHWRFYISQTGCRVGIVENGSWQEAAAASMPATLDGRTTAIQVLDDGSSIQVAIDGRPVFASQVHDSRLASSAGVGLVFADPRFTHRMEDFEAHPRTLPIPPALKPHPQALPVPGPVVFDEQFNGQAVELGQRETRGKSWRKEIGAGIIDLPGDGSARVRASVSQPNPGRTAYTLEWDDPDYADLQVEITPPGRRRGQGEHCRGGLIFWQDARNYLIISTWLDDIYPGASISSFFNLHGFEELYDAVWTNVGRRVYWGKPFVLRVTFDGSIFTAFIDDEPVLFRALTDVYPDFQRLSIRRVGLVANWEWGNDTGSVFRQFVAKGKGI